MFIVSTSGHHFNLNYLRHVFVVNSTNKVAHMPVSAGDAESDADSWIVQAYFGESNLPVPLFIAATQEEAETALGRIVGAMGGVVSLGG